MNQVYFLVRVYLKNLFRQKTVVFSSVILPMFTLWATWWVTADLPMVFDLANSDNTLLVSMIDVHVVTGALTAMAITAGLYGYIITVEHQRINSRLELNGYSPSTIGLAMFFTLLVSLSFSIILTTYFANVLIEPRDSLSLSIAIFLVSLVYVALGNLLAIVLPKSTEGILIILIAAFIDLMMLTNPMGGGVYLDTWTYYLPGFWPVQVALQASFVGDASFETMVYPVIYFLLQVILILILKNSRKFSKNGGPRELINGGK